MALRDGGGHLGSRWVLDSHESREDEVLFERLTTAVSRDETLGDRQHAQPLGGHRVVCPPMTLGVVGGERNLDSVGEPRQPSARYTWRAVIRFSVRVPVLSVQMTVADPSVSTAGRCRTTVCRLAIRFDAMAMASVTVGSSPSGTLATMMPMANTKLCQNDRLSTCPITKQSAPRSVARHATRRLNRAISRWSGEGAPRPLA
jgi:hypothetical protein